MSGGGSADPPPPQWPNGGEFLLSLLQNPPNAHHHHRRRPPHPHGNNRFNNNPPRAQHLPFPGNPIPLDPAVAGVVPAIVPSDVHDRLSPPWPPHGLCPPSRRPSPHLIYPHSFASRPAVPNPNHQFVHAGCDLRRGDLGGTGFVDIRLPHQLHQRDLSVGSLGFSPADSISSGSLGFDITGKHQVRSLGAIMMIVWVGIRKVGIYIRKGFHARRKTFPLRQGICTRMTLILVIGKSKIMVMYIE